MTFTVGEVLPRDWLRWMRLPNGKPPRLDVWGHNPFSTRFPKLSDGLLGPKFYDFNDLDALHKDVAKVYRHAYPSKFKHAGPEDLGLRVHDPGRPRLAGLQLLRLAGRPGQVGLRGLSRGQ